MKKTPIVAIGIVAIVAALSAGGMFYWRSTAKTADTAIGFADDTFSAITASWNGEILYKPGTAKFRSDKAADSISEHLGQPQTALGERRSYKMTEWDIGAYTSAGITATVRFDAEFTRRNATFEFVLRRSNDGNWRIDDLRVGLGPANGPE